MVLITQSGPETLAIGSPAPGFAGLPGTDGKAYGLADFTNYQLVVINFTCNHCPYAMAYEDRFTALAHEFMPQGVAFVAINSNDVVHYPADDMAHMQQRCQEKAFPFPYLRDDSQAVAKAYGAVCTPHLFVLDRERKLAYEGRIDDSWKHPGAVTREDLRVALESLRKGETPAQPQTNPMGCSIKWL